MHACLYFIHIRSLVCQRLYAFEVVNRLLDSTGSNKFVLKFCAAYTPRSTGSSTSSSAYAVLPSPYTPLTNLHPSPLRYRVPPHPCFPSAAIRKQRGIKNREKQGSRRQFPLHRRRLGPSSPHTRWAFYPGARSKVDNEKHCDFVKLRRMSIWTNMEEFRKHTSDVVCENWRSEGLSPWAMYRLFSVTVWLARYKRFLP